MLRRYLPRWVRTALFLAVVAAFSLSGPANGQEIGGPRAEQPPVLAEPVPEGEALAHWMREWGVADPATSRGGVVAPQPSPPARRSPPHGRRTAGQFAADGRYAGKCSC